MNTIIWTTLGIGIVGLGLLLALLIEKIADRYAGDPLPESGAADQTPDGLRQVPGESYEDFQTRWSTFHGLEIGKFQVEDTDPNENEKWLL